MARYIDKGNMGFREARNSEYVDKSGLISVVNSTLGTKYKFSCVSRARRFGKSMAAEMLMAYYDRSCDSRELFEDLEIAHNPSFEQHLNKYPVIYLDMTEFITDYRNDAAIVTHIQEKIKADIETAYPQLPPEHDETFMSYLQRLSLDAGDRFIMIIDEWDAICREFDPKSPVMDNYIDWLRRMFKSASATEVFAGVYMTGILPIKKYDTQSALNNFTEYSMIDPGNMARYFGFAHDEVEALARKWGMDVSELEKWYDGYQIGEELSMFNPNSVMQAILRHRCHSYWGRTAAYDTVATYIKMDFEGLRDDITQMLAGQRTRVNTGTFLNDMHDVSSRDDVLTLLIHLGYLSFEWNSSCCYIPNLEVSKELENAIRLNNWRPVVDAIQQSEQLLEALLRGDADSVARGVETVHRQEVSLFKYNDENSMACVISLAFYAARNDFHVHREYQTGDGYADLVLIPRKNVAKPAVVIELKYDQTVTTAITQIKQKHYPEKIQDYTGNMLLVAITYHRDSKQHECHIEHYTKP